MRPIFITRLVDESGLRISGGIAARGSSVVASFTRSATRCRAVIRSVPGLNSITTCDRPTTDDERITSTPGVPRSASSSGTVISSSTSDEVIPMASVCTSTLGGANSGNTSTGIRRSSSAPNRISATAAARTRKRKRRLERMIQENNVCLFLRAAALAVQRPRHRRDRCHMSWVVAAIVALIVCLRTGALDEWQLRL